MAKTRQENLNQVFGSMDKFGKKLDIIADKLDNINNQLFQEERNFNENLKGNLLIYLLIS